jgi:hypothetical protein
LPWHAKQPILGYNSQNKKKKRGRSQQTPCFMQDQTKKKQEKNQQQVLTREEKGKKREKRNRS